MTTENWQQANEAGADTAKLKAKISDIWAAHTQLHHTLMGVLGWRKYKKPEIEAIAHLHREKITTLGDVIKAMRTYGPTQKMGELLDEAEVLNTSRNYVMHGILMHNAAADTKNRDEDYGFGRSTRTGGEFRTRSLSDLEFWDIDSQILATIAGIKAEFEEMLKAA